MNKIILYTDLSKLLIKVLDLLIHKRTKPEFDLDNEYISLFEKYNLNSSDHFVRLIYTYLDVLCDAKSHNFAKINENYSFENFFSSEIVS